MVSKRLYKVSGEWPDKEVANAQSSMAKKRKLSDTLDAPWSNEELKQFYEALRKHGTNWKKVAGAICNRSIDMVEHLYNLNRAYLSLPEGTATEAGFLAMMTDHYNNLDGSDSDHEKISSSKKTVKLPKSARRKPQRDKSKGSDGHYFNHLQNQSAPSSYRRVSKKYFEAPFFVNWSAVVGKRTPRIPIIDNPGDIVDTASRSKKTINDGGVSLVRDSPLDSGKSGMTELIQSDKENHTSGLMATPSWVCLGKDSSCLEGLSGRMEINNGICGRDTRISDIDSGFQHGTQCKVKRLEEMRQKDTRNKRCRVDNLGEEESLNAINLDDRVNEEASGKKNAEFFEGWREKPLTEDEESALASLQMLVFVSSNTASQASLLESDPAVHGDKQHRKDPPNSPHDPRALSAKPETDNLKIPIERDGRRSVFSFHRANVPGPIVRENSQIRVHSDMAHYSNFGVDDVPLNEAKLRNTVSRNFIENSSSEANMENCQDTIKMQQTSADDIDCVAANPCESMPKDARVHDDIVNKFCNTSSSKNSDGCFKEFEYENSANLAILPEEPCEPIGIDFNVVLTSSRKLESHGSSLSPSSELTTLKSLNQANDVISEKFAATLDSLGSRTWMEAQIKSKEHDIKAIFELTRALDKKEAILKELKHMNDQISRELNGGKLTVDSEHVREQYYPLLKLLGDVSDEVNFSVHNIRQRNTYNESSAPHWFRSLEKSAESEIPAGSSISDYQMDQDLGSEILEIVSSSKQKAKVMVDTAVLAISSLKEGEDAYMRIEKALDSLDNRHCRAGVSSRSETQIPSQLILDCVATMFMIQDTSNTRFPPAEVARVLENAVESLKPKCPENLPVYKDIERRMGYIKSQLFSLVAEPITSLSPKIPV